MNKIYIEEVIFIKIFKSNDLRIFSIYGIVFILIVGYSLVNISKLFIDSHNVNFNGYIKAYNTQYFQPGRGSSYQIYTPVVTIMENGVSKDIVIPSAESKIMPNHIGDEVNIILFNNNYFINTPFYKLVEIFHCLELVAIYGFIFILMVIFSNRDNLKSINLKDKGLISFGLLCISIEATIAIGILYTLKINQISILNSTPKFIICMIAIILFLLSLIVIIVDIIKKKKALV